MPKKPNHINPKNSPSSKRSMTSKDYVTGILKGDRGILARSITLVESRHPEYRKVAEEIIEACLPYSGKSFRLGITGVPGVGKSSFIESFGSLLIQNGNKLAVLAIDPSSDKSRGSIFRTQCFIHQGTYMLCATVMTKYMHLGIF